MNIVTISVNGVEYKLKGEESKEYMNSIAREVDDKLRDMIQANKNLTVNSSAILLAINYCDVVHKLNNEKDELSNSIDICNSKIQALIDENNDLKEKIIHIENAQQEVQLKNVKLEEEIEAYNTLLKEDKDSLFSDNNEIQELEKEIEILKETIKKMKQENSELHDKFKV